MKKIKIFLASILILSISIFLFNKKDSNYSYTKLASINLKNEKKIEINDKNHEIKVYYPISEYPLLDKEITNKINDTINEFKKLIDGFNGDFYLYITYKSYQYQNYLSYVFDMEFYTGGAHPNHDIWTVTYDLEKKKIITIKDLINLNPDILNTLSSLSRKELLHKKGIVDTSMLMSGTEPLEENFSRFVFSKNGLILFFHQYQVAPYSSGEFIVTIDYKNVF